MNELFLKLKEYEQSQDSAVLTVIEGENFGEKALFSRGELIWESKKQGFFHAYRDEFHGRSATGKLLIGGVHVFCDCIARAKELVICGGGHVSMPIIELGRMLGFHVTVLEDRPYFADMARNAGADCVVCQPFEEALAEQPGSEDTYFVIVTRGHRYDQICLERILSKPYAYLGMMGSRGRVAVVKEHLREKGFTEEQILTLHSPIGLSIRAETPAEIAVSVMAEIIQEKNAQKRSNGYSKEIMEAIVDQDEVRVHGLLATIVSRRGSAPRAVGTKMLILPDGRTKGTIGGGCMEAEVIRKGIQMLRIETEQSQLCQVDMSGEDAEEEGMACGGNIDVLMEIV